jgi:hypothetical protein
VAARHQREEPGVDVAAGEHDDRRALAGGLDERGEQRRDADRAGSLDDELRALHQDHHRLGRVLLADHHDLVDPARDQRQREIAGPFDGDPVGDRRGRVDGDRRPGRERGRIGRAGSHLDADDAHLRVRRLDDAGDPRDQAAAAERHDDRREIGHLVEQFKAERRLPEDHQRVIEGVNEHGAGLCCARSRAAATQSSTLSPPSVTDPP